MSRSIQRSKCNRSCLMCKPHKVTGERPIAEQRREPMDELRAADAWSYEVANEEFDRLVGLA